MFSHRQPNSVKKCFGTNWSFDQSQIFSHHFRADRSKDQLVKIRSEWDCMSINAARELKPLVQEAVQIGSGIEGPEGLIESLKV